MIMTDKIHNGWWILYQNSSVLKLRLFKYIGTTCFCFLLLLFFFKYLLICQCWVLVAVLRSLVAVFGCSMWLLSCGMGIWLLDQGLNPGPLHWECGVLTTGSQEKFLDRILINLSMCSQGFAHNRPAAGVHYMKKWRMLFLKTSSPAGRNDTGFTSTQYRSIMISKQLDGTLFLLDHSYFLLQSFLAKFPFVPHWLTCYRVEEQT